MDDPEVVDRLRYLPTEFVEDMQAITDLAKKMIDTGRKVTGSPSIRSAGLSHAATASPGANHHPALDPS